MIPSESIEIKSIDMQSFTMTSEDKVSLSTDFVANIIPYDDVKSIENTVDMPALQSASFL